MPEMLREAPAPAPPQGTAGDRVGFRLAVFAALLLVAAFAGYGLGRLTGTPETADPGRPAATDPAAMPGMVVAEAQPHAHAPTAASVAAGGLAISAEGLTLVPRRTT